MVVVVIIVFVIVEVSIERQSPKITELLSEVNCLFDMPFKYTTGQKYKILFYLTNLSIRVQKRQLLTHSLI